MNRSLFLTRLAVAGLVASGTALAQNDDCANATVVTVGMTPFTTVGATLSAEPWNCAAAMAPDIWFEYVATSTADLQFETCGSTYDTALEVYTGTCGALNLVQCNDDSCGLQSAITVSGVTTGTTYIFRIGGFASSSGSGTLTVSEILPPPPPSGSISGWLGAVGAGTPASYTNSLLQGPIIDDIGMTDGTNGVSYEFIVYGSNAGISSGLMGARGTGVGSDAGLKFEQCCDSLAYGVTEWNIVDLYFSGGNTELQDIQLVFVADPTAGTTELFVDGVSFGTVPSAPVLQGMQGIGQIHDPNVGPFDVMSLGRVHGVAVYEAQLSQAEIADHRNAYLSGTLGMNYCMANANSTGVPATITALGSSAAASNDVTLMTTDMPNNSFAFYIVSQTQGFVANPNGSQGNLCVGGAIGRYVGPGQIQQSNSMGEISLVLDLTQLPQPTGFVTVFPGDTWNWSTWYRDFVGAPTSNFSNGVSVTFL